MFYICIFCDAQYLRNPSFEDVPLPPSTPIIEWTSCVQTPDRQPGNFNITLPAFNGQSYVGLGKSDVLHGSETTSQVFYNPINKDSVYFFAMQIANQPTTGFYSPDFALTFPGFVYVQMGTQLCSKKNIIFKSFDILEYTTWKQSCGIFKPDSNFTVITLTPWGYDEYSLLGTVQPNFYKKYPLIDDLELSSIQNKLSYNLLGSNTSVCAGNTVSLSLTGLPTCLGTGFSVTPSTASVTRLTSHLSLFSSTIPGVYTVSGFAQTGTVTSWPVYQVVTVSGCPPHIPTITGLATVCSLQAISYQVSTQAGVSTSLWGFPPPSGFTSVGVYVLTATAANLYCTVSGFYTVTVTDCSPPLTPTITGLATVCNLQAISYQVSTQAGVGTSLLGFPPPSGFTSVGVYVLTATAANLYGTVSGFYTVTVTDCSPPLTPTITGLATVCSLQVTSYQVSTQAGVSTALWGFPPPSGFTSVGVYVLSATAANLYGTVSGFYTVTVTDCSPPLTPTITGLTTVCSLQAISYQVSTQAGESTTLWGFPPPSGFTSVGVYVLTATAANLYGTVSGFYTVTVTDCSPPLITCTGGCPPNTSCTGTVCSPIVISETATCSGLNCTEILTCSGSDCVNCFGVVCTVPGTCIGSNCNPTPTDTCTSAFPPCTCPGLVCDTVVPPKPIIPVFKVYTAFTPNGDAANATWVIDSLYPPNEITIVDKWGNEVYKASPYNNDWDGKNNGKDLPTGVYYYILDYQNRKRAGVVTIVR